MHYIYRYIRVSSREQLKGDGPDRQRDAIAAFCDTHKLQCLGSFLESTSGTVDGMDRPAFSDMLDRIPHLAVNGLAVEAIVVERMDRIARDLMVSEVLLAECRKRGVKVYSADQGALIDMAADGGDPTRILIRQLMAALAQWEKTTLVRKLKAARDRKKATGAHCEGNVPYGTAQGETEMLAYLFALRSQPEPPSWAQTAAAMNTAGLVNRNGKPWTRSNVFELFKAAKARRAV